MVESRSSRKDSLAGQQHGVKTHFFEDSNVLVRDGGLPGFGFV